jgi:hypothetical protein
MVAAAVALLGGVGTASLALAAPAGATIAVKVPCNGGDPAALIAAINAANRKGGGVINLAAGCVYKLTVADNETDGGNGLPVVASSILLNGNGSTVRDAAAENSFRILEIAEGANLTVNNLVLTGGSPAEDSNNVVRGGGIFNKGVLLLHQTRVTNNKTKNGLANSGGGIYNTNTLRLNASSVTNNSGGNFGGGIFSEGLLVINSSTVSENTAGDNPRGGPGTGGGIQSTGRGLTLTNSVVEHNTVSTDGFGAAGGGILSQHETFTASNSRVSDNVASTGGGEAGSMPAHGGGINNDLGTLILKGVTVRNNTVAGLVPETEIEGGGIFINGRAFLSGSTVDGNHALGEDAQGGGIFRAAGMVSLLGTPVINNSPTNCAPPLSVSGCSN